MPNLTKEGLIRSAKQAAQYGLSFNAYCEIISRVVISEQSKVLIDETSWLRGSCSSLITLADIAEMLTAHGIHLYFEDDADGNQRSER